VCVIDSVGALAGVVSMVDLVRSGSDTSLSSLLNASTPTVSPDDDLPEVARLMSDFNLIALPVVDREGRPIGIIAVDDVLEELIPEEWRRRAGVARG
jgi:Mg/Co/Ni transporter MgtE